MDKSITGDTSITSDIRHCSHYDHAMSYPVAKVTKSTVQPYYTILAHSLNSKMWLLLFYTEVNANQRSQLHHYYYT